MFSRFFIYRPVFALVIAIVIVLIGGITIPILPIENTPDITPPTVSVKTNFPGASAPVIAETVATPLEQEINGVDNMIYMQSKSSDDSTMEITVTFQIGVDIDMSTVLVQNRVAVADPKMPAEVKQQGITTKKKSTNMVLVINLFDGSGQGLYDEIYISNYINLNIKDVLGRVPGVAEALVMGAKDYGMRVWLDPDRLKARNLTTNDVVNAIREQNVQVAAGQIGAPPSPTDQSFQYTVNTMGRLSDVAQFEDMILKVEDGRILRVRDVARVELGAQSYNWSVQLNGDPSIAIAIYQLPGANALNIAQAVNETMDELAARFPDGLEYTIAYDSTRAITASIDEVVETLFIAILLVVLTVYVFLQDFRTTLIPSVTIPVSLIGTFGVMMALGMSINTLTLFGIVLAIGIVVDDAIVVVENTMRLIDDEGLDAKEATAKAMEEVTGPVVATTLVLLAVFVPTTMMGGITGRLYAQFSMTIATATVFSSINALTLSPALCGMLLRPTPQTRGWFFTQFNHWFDKSTNAYMGLVKLVVRRTAIMMLIWVAVVAAMAWSFSSVPGGFLPDEDQGYYFANIKLPDAASLERTNEVAARMTQTLMDAPGVADVITVGGYSFLDSMQSSNAAGAIVVLDDWSERTEPALHAAALAALSSREIGTFQEGIGFAFIPPPIMGLGNAGGFEFVLQDRGASGYLQLQTIGDDLVFEGNQDPVITRLNNNFRANVPQLYLDVDRTKVKTLGIPLSEVFATLQSYLGSSYVNDFNVFGRTYRVMIQADAGFRAKIEDIERLDVRDQDGNMIPLSTLVTVSDTVGPQAVIRYNLYPAATISGSARPGFSSGESVQAMESLASRLLPASMGFEWTGTTYQQLAAGGQAPIIFGLAFIMVFLFLAAQYESWLIPIAVILSIPFSMLGAMLATMFRAYDNNVYTQIGVVLLIGLSAKTAILIVEFAKQLREQDGLPTIEAAIKAAELRFRPLLMTAFSFILGVIPLVVATGAGSGSRTALGTAVFGGMSLATVLGVIFIPVFYVVVQKMRDPRMQAAAGDTAGDGPAGGDTPTGGDTPPTGGDKDGGGEIDTAGPEPAAGAARTMGAIALALLLIGTGCTTVGPDYVRPATPMPDGSPLPDTWHTTAMEGLEEGNANLQQWWTAFNDPVLDDLMDRAWQQNLDIELALARIQEARAIYGITTGDRMPVIDATGSAGIARTNEAGLPTSITGDTNAVLTLGVDASWEIDVFGRIARNIESALASYEASVESYRDVLVSLFSEVAFAYIDVRSLQDRIEYAQANIEAQEDSLQLTRDRFSAGLTSRLDVAQAESNLADTKARIPLLVQSLAFAHNRLAVLLGTTPGSLDDELDGDAEIPMPPAAVTRGIPADLLRQRPDIRRAERILAAQTARIGVATADLYPTFSLTGFFTFGLASGDGNTTGFGWNILPGFRWNLFDRERIRNSIRAEEAITEQAYVTYEQTVLVALEDVENAMIAYARENERLVQLEDAVDASQRAVDLVRTQYLSGLTHFQNVLDSQRTLFQLQDQLAESQGIMVQDLVLMYRALGGGWELPDPSATGGS